MIDRRGFEISGQHIPVTPEEMVPLGGSDPLHMLADHAPDVSGQVNLAEVHFPFSNDDSSAYYEQLQARTAMPEYREATNRTAVLVGEGSLMTALRFIPEDTIVLLDKSPEMCAYMERYVDTLRTAETFEEWAERMGIDGEHAIPGSGVPRALEALKEQAFEWLHAGYGHPVGEADLYAEAHALAQEKAIIPWQADFRDKRDMKRLGKALNSHEANVTMINITNAAADMSVAVEDAGLLARRLGHMPVTPNAPIMATSYVAKPPVHHMVQGKTVEAVGPFFGLDNLAQHGDDSILEGLIDTRKELAALALLSALFEDGPFGHTPRGTGGNGDFGGMIVASFGPDGLSFLDASDLPPEIRALIDDDPDF